MPAQGIRATIALDRGVNSLILPALVVRHPFLTVGVFLWGYIVDLTKDRDDWDLDADPKRLAYDKALRAHHLKMGFIAKHRFGNNKLIPKRRFANPRCPNIKEHLARKWVKKHRVRTTNWVQSLPMDMEFLKYHFGCIKMAGQGTTHPGFGLCKYCEKYWMEKHNTTKAELDELAEDHAEVLANHGAVGYVPPDNAIMQYKQDEAAAETKLKLYDEVANVVQLIDRLMLEINGTDEQKRPLTMYVNKQQVEMDDKTRLELACKFLNSGGKLKEIHDRMESRKSISEEKFTIYCSRMAQLCQKYTDPKDWPNLVAEIREIPSPMKG